VAKTPILTLTVKPDPNALMNGLEAWRKELRKIIATSLSQMDASAPETLQSAIAAMLEAHYKPKTLSKILGPSQTTIARWADGATIPRSPPYRKWLVETLIAYLGEQEIDGSGATSIRGAERHREPPTPPQPQRPRRNAANPRRGRNLALG